MRLTQQEIKAIKKTFKEVFEEGDIYLFGSRVDDTKRGGDIDLYVDTPLSLNTRESLEKKSKFRLKLYELIGEQKINIEKEILKSGVLL